MKIAIVLHLYYTDLWPEFQHRLCNVRDVVGEASLDIFITLKSGEASDKTEAEIRHAFPAAYVRAVADKGMDVGPFLLWMREVYERDLDRQYDLVLKLHTKKSLRSAGATRGNELRAQLADAIAGSSNAVHECLRLLGHTSAGIVGSSQAISDYVGSNEPQMEILRAWLGVPRTRLRFVAGTMFWIRMCILRRFFTQAVLGPLYECMPERYAEDGTPAHALERLFGCMALAAGFELIGVDAPNWRNQASRVDTRQGRVDLGVQQRHLRIPTRLRVKDLPSQISLPSDHRRDIPI